MALRLKCLLIEETFLIEGVSQVGTSTFVVICPHVHSCF